MHEDNPSTEGRSLVSLRTMDIVVAVLFLIVSGIVILDSVRLGFGWLEGEGPAPGYFPFYIALVIAAASVLNLARAILRLEPGSDGIFVTAPAFGRVLTVLVPGLVYVALIGGFSFGFTTTLPESVTSLVGLNGPIEVPIGIPRLGIYVASAIFIFGFMMLVGRESIIKALGVSIIVPTMLFLMFEKWFLVPLPKGPLEAWLLGL
jgi:hypothetical protein